MGVIQRLMNTYRAARTAWSDQGESVPDPDSLWDVSAVRIARYKEYDAYLHNIHYKLLRKSAKFLKRDPKLYRFIRGLINFVAREIDICSAKCYGGSIDYERFRTGAIPFEFSDEKLIEPVKRLFLASNMGVEKSVIVRTASHYGDVVSKIVDEPRKKHVRIEFPHPSKLKDAKFDGVGNVIECVFEYEKEETDENGKVTTYIYREEITKNEQGFAHYATFKDDEPFGFFVDGTGKTVSEWDTPYPFIPVAVGRWKKMPGLDFGANAYYHVLDKLDERNDLLSALYDHIRRALHPTWAGIGVTPPSPKTDGRAADLDLKSPQRDDDKIIYITNENARFQSLVHDVALSPIIEADGILKTEMYDDLPELAMGSLRNSGNLTDPGVTAGYNDAVDRLTDGNGNIDDFLVRTTQMGVTIGAIGGYDGFTDFNVNSFDNGELRMFIKPREIIKDDLSKLEQLQAFQALGFDEKILELLNVSEEVINKFLMEKKSRQLAANNPPPQTNGAPADQPATDGATNTPAIRGSKLPTDQATKNSLTDEKLSALFDEFHSTRGKVK